MRKNFWQYYWNTLHNFGEAVINLFIFLPYFFSVSTLFKTLLSSWRNIVTKKTIVGFSLSDLGNRMLFGLISRSIGFCMRISMICFYFIFQTLFMILLPFAALSFFVFTPFFYLFYLTKSTPDEQKNALKVKFIENHLLKDENKSQVEEWFEIYYQEHLKKISWWKLSNLLTYPPLARDWAVGYTPILDQYSTDLATGYYLHHIKNIVDREKEIGEIEQILVKSVENNVLIVGSEGVGKHTIVDAFAKKIYLGNTNINLMYKRILKLNMEKIFTSFTDQKQRESFFEDLLVEAEQAKNIILFIDNIDKYITNGDGSIDLTNSIEKYAKSSFVQIIGITTPFAFQNYIFNNEKINRIFSIVDVYEISNEKAKNILLNAVYSFELLYKVKIPYETVNEVIEKSEYYLTSIPFPEKAVDLLDTACVFTSQNQKQIVTPEIINAVLSDKTHIPTVITKQMKEKLLNLETLLFSKVIQQDEAVNQLSSALRRSFLLIGKRKKPLASFLFLGPTGVGKTQTAKAISEVFFSNHLLRFDMSEFQSKYDIPKLIGDSDKAGLLTRAIRENNYGVLLLDEFEKADSNLINIFLTILDEAYFFDGKGSRVDCKNLILVATSNAKDIKVFPPELLNRFDGVVTFQSLNKESIKVLAKKIIDKISVDIFKLYNVKISVSQNSLNLVSEKGYNPKSGARFLERTIRDEIENKIAKIILADKVKPGEKINI